LTIHKDSETISAKSKFTAYKVLGWKECI